MDGFANENSPLIKKKRRLKSREVIGKICDPKDGLGDREDAISEWNDSSTLNDEEVDGQSSWTSGFDTPEGRKTARAEKKLAKNQTRFNFITPSDLQHIQGVLHPNVLIQAAKKVGEDQDLVNNATLETNIAFNAHCFKWGSLRQMIHEKKTAKSSGLSKAARDLQDKERKIMQDILEHLGIRTPAANNTKERKALYNKLNTAIRADLIALENEKAETMQRMAGYWHYVNRRTYNAMVRTNMLWDWATGQKLPEIDESELGDVTEEDGESMSDTTPATTPPMELEELESWKGDFMGSERKERGEEEYPGDKTPTANSFQFLNAGLVYLSGKPQVEPLSETRLSVLTLASNASTQVTDNTSQGQPTRISSDRCTDLSPPPRKDDRILDKAIRAASPPREGTPSSKPLYYTTKKTPKAAAKSINLANANLNNAYESLQSEIPAPCEDPQLPNEQTHIHSHNRLGRPPQSEKDDFPALSGTSANTADTDTKTPAKLNIKVLNITAAIAPERSRGWQRGKNANLSTGAGGKKLCGVDKASARSAMGEDENAWTDVVRGGSNRR